MANRTPKLLPLPPGTSLASFPLSPTDGFVLSRIDGAASDTELVGLTGIGLEQIQDTLRKLSTLGLVEYEGPARQLQASTAPQENASRPPEAAAAVPRGGAAFTSDDATLKDHPAMSEDVDLDPNHRLRILDLEKRLGELHHYALLGVARDANKKAIKRAYYELAALFHPDRFFRKKLGSFKAKMEAIFTRITEAHDVLTDEQRRAEYDAYIGEVDPGRDVDADLILDLPPVSSTPAPTPVVTVSAPPEPRMPTESRPPTTGISLPEQARRDALARRLLGARAASGLHRAITNPPPADTEALRRHYEQRKETARTQATKAHLDAANAALAKNDPVAAATAFRLALEIAPDDAELRRSFEDAQKAAAEVLFLTYRKQAQYEDKHHHFEEAARSWRRAAKAKPDDAESHDRAAYCLAKSNGDLHEAARLAQAAIALNPKNAMYHVTLYLVYTAAGLGLNAKRELEAASRLAPDDEAIQALVKRSGKD